MKYLLTILLFLGFVDPLAAQASMVFFQEVNGDAYYIENKERFKISAGSIKQLDDSTQVYLPEGSALKFAINDNKHILNSELSGEYKGPLLHEVKFVTSKAKLNEAGTNRADSEEAITYMPLGKLPKINSPLFFLDVKGFNMEGIAYQVEDNGVVVQEGYFSDGLDLSLEPGQYRIVFYHGNTSVYGDDFEIISLKSFKKLLRKNSSKKPESKVEKIAQLYNSSFYYLADLLYHDRVSFSSLKDGGANDSKDKALLRHTLDQKYKTKELD